MVENEHTSHPGVIILLLSAVAWLWLMSCAQDPTDVGPTLAICATNAVLDGSGQPAPSSCSDSATRATLDLDVPGSYHIPVLVENVGPSSEQDHHTALEHARLDFESQSTSSAVRTCLSMDRELGVSGTLASGESLVVDLELIDQARADCLSGIAELQTRGATIEATYQVRVVGMTTSNIAVESNPITYTLSLCRGCLLEFPSQ
jgi:hypothetical protein